MLYMNEKVEIPRKSTFTQVIGKYTYLYMTVESFYNDKHQQRHRKKSLGRVVRDEDGKERLIPNDNYYELCNLPKPAAGEVKKSGPQRKSRPPKFNDRPALHATGYALAIKRVAEDLKLYEILEDLLGPERAKRALAIAAFYACCDGSPDLGDFSYFMEDCMAPLFKPFDGRGVLYEFKNGPCHFLEDLIKRWNALQGRSDCTPVLHEAISFSTTSQMTRGDMLGYGTHPDDLEKTCLAVICSPSSHRPLCLCEYLDAINDVHNLKTVEQVCKNAGLSSKFDVVCDCQDYEDLLGGEPDFGAFKGHGILTPVSFKKHPKVRKAILEHLGELQQGLAEHVVQAGRFVLFAISVPLALGQTEGTLMIILNPALKARCTPGLVKKQARLRSELEAAKSYPSDPSRYEGFFKIAKDTSAKGFAFKDDVTGFADLISLCGIVAFYTTRRGFDLKEALGALKAKAQFEKILAHVKNDSGDGRVVIHDESALKSKLAYLFLALIIFNEMQNRLIKVEDDFKELTLELCLKELQRIKLVKADDGTLNPAGTLSAAQQAVFEAVCPKR